MSVNHRQIRRRNSDILSIFFNMKVYCVFTLESPHRGDSNEYTQYTIFQYDNEKHPKLSQICSYGIFSYGLKNEFERAVVNEPPVFELLKFYCIALNLAYMKAQSEWNVSLIHDQFKNKTAS